MWARLITWVVFEIIGAIAQHDLLIQGNDGTEYRVIIRY